MGRGIFMLILLLSNSNGFLISRSDELILPHPSLLRELECRTRSGQICDFVMVLGNLMETLGDLTLNSGMDLEEQLQQTSRLQRQMINLLSELGPFLQLDDEESTPEREEMFYRDVGKIVDNLRYVRSVIKIKSMDEPDNVV